jgi:ferredoxin
MSAAWSEGKPLVVEAACNGCDLCVLSCPYDAISIVDKLAVIDLEACARCGLCVTRCRRGAIEWAPAVAAV